MILVNYYYERNSNYMLMRKKMYIDISKIQYITISKFDWIGNAEFITIGINGERICLSDEDGCNLLSRMGLSVKDLEDET